MSPAEDQEPEASVPKKSDKVELDLDDAPFLDDEDEAEEPEAAPVPQKEAPAPIKTAAEEPEKKSKKKLLLTAGAAFFLLCGIGLWLFLKQDTPPAPPPAPEKKEEENSEPLAREEKRVIQLEPFFIEYRQDGKSRFLECALSLSSPNIIQNTELRKHFLEIRDALYFYLKNKDIFFLENKKNAQQFKKEILEVINQHISSMPVTDILIDKYLVR